MISLSDIYKLPGPNIVHQTIDGETIILNLKKGYYYSLPGSASQIWAALLAGYSLGDILKGREENEKILASFVEELLKEDLLVSGAVAAQESRTDLGSLLNLPVAPSQPPVLQKYTDMEDLLLLDPIHEVDETGWPNSRKDGKS